ncbi:MAG: SGNH/GDSL hydrolase family protein [Desulfocapsa sp.]|uniref:SGNH/GDSL hydrolase family protein n=1 Tax=Desulfotalea psychrophila TaxID=84980 RepID=A0ABS3ASN4_9BACT|nr:SGNH/GDSL hydrolase family protein [Desulfocapsa sp.]MBN4068120.1 SGNH/GDSL hydrolase family protein [Desulfotalea psychrophila]
MHRKIFAVGDSHSRRCFEGHDQIADSRVLVGYNKLDGKTAYNLEHHEKKLLRILNPLHDKELVFCFGEVDVRLHIKYKHLQLGTPVQQLIDKTAWRYTSYVHELRKAGHRIHIFNVVPTGDFRGEDAEKWKRGLTYPFTATFEERSSYTEQLNAAYGSYCREFQIPFIDIYEYLVDDQGQRREDLIFDYAHINNSCADLVLKHHSFPEPD